MPEFDEDRIELLERQLAEKVTARVRPALFRLYASVGTAVIAVLGFVGWDVITDLKSEIKSELLEQVDEEIGEKKKQILENTTETQFLAKRANDIIQRVELQLNEFEPKAETLNETIDKVKTLNVASKDFTAIYNQELEPLIANVEALSSQLSVLAEQVDQLNNIIAMAEDLPEPVAMAPEETVRPSETPLPPRDEAVKASEMTEQRSMAIQSVITEARQAEQRLLEARAKPTVFFQFAGGSREQAEALSASLKDLGYSVPGEDRERYASGKHEVRFFHDDDREAAVQLALDTTRALRKLGYDAQAAPDVSAESFIAYAGKKPRLGVLELWLEMP